MREILFRGKSIDNGKWVKGYLLKIPSPIQLGDNSPWFIDVPPQDPDGIHSRFNVDEKTIGQYTGLTDKNGKKIFEGDIVAYLSDDGMEELTVVAFYEKEARFVQQSIDEDIAFETLLGYDVTIVGNIHDNPELLKGE